MTNVSTIVSKDDKGKFTPIDPKSPLAAQLAAVTMTRAEAPSDVVKLLNEQSSSTQTSSSSPIDLGAAIGVPVAAFVLCLFLCFFYRRNPFLYTRHRDAVTFAGRWLWAAITCKLSSIQRESSIVRPKSRSSFTRLENEQPHSDSDGSDADVSHPAPTRELPRRPEAAPSSARSAPDAAIADDALPKPKAKSNVPDVPRQSRWAQLRHSCRCTASSALTPPLSQARAARRSRNARCRRSHASKCEASQGRRCGFGQRLMRSVSSHAVKYLHACLHTRSVNVAPPAAQPQRTFFNLWRQACTSLTCCFKLHRKYCAAAKRICAPTAILFLLHAVRSPISVIVVIGSEAIDAALGRLRMRYLLLIFIVAVNVRLVHETRVLC